ncbi:MAG: glycosyltransferase family 39 protein [Bryobacteraceae bacterium]|jgi:hypothetical protein
MPFTAGDRVVTEQPGKANQLAAIPILLIALVALGAGLRLWQYFANPAIWLDEIAVARNILDRPLRDLLTLPLAYDQSAPKGFLLLEKAATSLFGSSDYVLRFFPLLSSLVALVVFWRIVLRCLDDLAGLVALALFATAAPYVVFASQVKQYSFDIAVALLLFWLALDVRGSNLSVGKALRAGIAGAVLVWFSQPSVLVVCALGASLTAFFALNDRHRAPDGYSRFLAMTLGLWLASGLVAALAGLTSVTAATKEYMHRYWVAGFPPVPISRVAKTLWPWDQLERILGAGGPASLIYPVPTIFFGLIVLGFVALWRRDRFVTTLLLAPFGLTLAAAIARQYPFSDRLILFLTPTFFIAIGASAEQIRQSLGRWPTPVGVFVPVLITASAVYPMAKTPPAYHLEDMKPELAYLQERRRPGDAVYVYYGAAPVVTFYAGSYGLRENDYAVGGCNRGDSRSYFGELDGFRGRPRVWVLITHSLALYRERDDILRYLDTIGLRRDSFATKSRLPSRVGSAAEVFLYDLSDPVRLSRATSLSSPVSGPSSVNARVGCGEGPQAMVASRGLATQ